MEFLGDAVVAVWGEFEQTQRWDDFLAVVAGRLAELWTRSGYREAVELAGLIRKLV